jgi:hypothetical protein
MFSIGGGISLALWDSGGVSFWAIGLAVVGLFTLLTGLLGDEGVW